MSSPSSSTPSQTTTSSSSDSTQVQTNNGNTTSSSLYLFTFLATLLLLLAVSCAIVARSLVVRRRFRRRVEDAIAAGLISPAQSPLGGGAGAFGVGGRRRDIGAKPVMWDAWLGELAGEAKWGDIMPVSVKVISEKLTGAGLPREPEKNSGRSSSSNNNNNNSDSNAQPRRRLLSAIPFPLTYHRSPAPAPAPAPAPPSSSTSSPSSSSAATNEKSTPLDDPTTPAELQVAVLIAMPSPYRPQSWVNASATAVGMSSLSSLKGKERSGSVDLDAEEDLPEVVFGVTELPWVPPAKDTDGDDAHSSSRSSSEEKST